MQKRQETGSLLPYQPNVSPEGQKQEHTTALTHCPDLAETQPPNKHKPTILQEELVVGMFHLRRTSQDSQFLKKNFEL